MQDFKLCLMAAGRGTRNDRFVNLHKALLPLANRPVISHILDCIDPTIEVVITLGHLHDQLRSYIEYVYPDRHFTFIFVDNYDGPGSGPGYSLLQCRTQLNCPFVFTSIDTLFNAKLEQPTNDWIGVSKLVRNELAGYCLVDIGPNEYVRKLYYDPDECLGNDVFIGIAGIHNHDDFWFGLENKNTINNEHQVINGFTKLRLTTKQFIWYDTGTSDKYASTIEYFPPPITTAKKDEVLYIDHGKVVKFFSDSNKIDNRNKRSAALSSCVPSITILSEHMDGYEYVLGNLLSHTYDEIMLDKFIDFCQEFFTECVIEDVPKFRESCDYMYRIKTNERIEPLVDTEVDLIEKVNGITVQPVKALLDQVNWDEINNKAIPFLFHGDFQPENIIVNRDRITLLDWRDSFGIFEDKTTVGDIYYDLGKLHHALIVNGTNIIDDKYMLEIRGSNAFINIDSRYNLILLMEKLQEFCQSRDYDWKHIKLLGALQYITIASLYDDVKYREFLFLFGKLCLTKCLRSQSCTN